MSEPKERPVIFSGPMVRAILDGRKTQTRRVVKHYETHACLTGDCPHERQVECDATMRDASPYGKPGDRLWVRETWRVASSGRHYPTGKTNVYVEWREQSLSRGSERGRQHRSEWECSDSHHDALTLTGYGGRVHTWRSPIHMPRWASRILLEVVSVRVERLVEISEADAIAEGVGRECCPEDAWDFDEGDGYFPPTSHVQGYANLWESINGQGSWDANPYVWVVEFKRVEGGAR